ncbi:MAG: ADP-ribosylglycohydrolase family protein [Clostridia bacterium]|nr:ADP-ribosylglycohydrolase family protein [Clostridia bacterium]
MPNYATWKNLYKDEFYHMTLEGCRTDGPAADGKPLVLPDAPGDVDWEKEYDRLWSVREKGLRPGYPYVEPVEYEDILKECSPLPELRPLDEDEYIERLSGAVRGRIAGVVLGKPVEQSLTHEKIKSFLEYIGEYPPRFYISEASQPGGVAVSECSRGKFGPAPFDDDIDYTLFDMWLVEMCGFGFRPFDVGITALGVMSYHSVWCSSRFAYRKMVNFDWNEGNIDEYMKTIPWKGNPYRECIDGAIKTDFWGYVCPGDPVKAAYYAYRDCSYSLAKNGVYGGMFVAGCVAAAMSKNPSVDSILDAGLAVIPKKSRLHEDIAWVRERYAATGGDFEQVINEIEKRFEGMPVYDTENNESIVALAILHGGLDYTETIAHAVACGCDTDCDSGTAGSIVGAAVGDRGVPEYWTEPFNDTMRSYLCPIGSMKISDFVKRIASLREKRLSENG